MLPQWSNNTLPTSRNYVSTQNIPTNRLGSEPPMWRNNRIQPQHQNNEHTQQHIDQPQARVYAPSMQDARGNQMKKVWFQDDLNRQY